MFSGAFNSTIEVIISLLLVILSFCFPIRLRDFEIFLLFRMHCTVLFIFMFIVPLVKINEHFDRIIIIT